LVQPVAVVSFGCHVSSGKSFNALMCEAAGGSFVTGVCVWGGDGCRECACNCVQASRKRLPCALANV
jgi:hypothetical protein